MSESRHPSRANAPRISRGLRSLVLIASLTAFGCGLAEDVEDRCQVDRRELEAAIKDRDGLIERNVDREKPVYRAAVERVRSAETNLRRCEDEASAKP
jgi:hypothetical protein